MTRTTGRWFVAAAVTAILAAPVSPLAQEHDRRPPPPSGQAREREPDDPQVRDRETPRETAQARPRSRPAPAPKPAPRPAPRVVSRGAAVVFVGGYYYDPYFGPYPWWPRPAYPWWYFPHFDHRAEVRIDCRERAAAVYVDGFYAGIVDDFDGLFQRLPLPPGGHRLTLYLEGFETADFNIYLHPGTGFTVHHTMRRLAPGSVSRRPELAPPLPPPPDGTYTPPRTAPPLPPPAAPSAAPENPGAGWLDLVVQPESAVVAVDGERWTSSGGGRYELQLPAGSHRIDITAPGYRAYSGDVDIRDAERTPLNVGLTKER